MSLHFSPSQGPLRFVASHSRVNRVSRLPKEEATYPDNSINFVYMRLPDLRRIARIAMARCTREAKFEAVQRHYIKIYQSNFFYVV